MCLRHLSVKVVHTRGSGFLRPLLLGHGLYLSTLYQSSLPQAEG